VESQTRRPTQTRDRAPGASAAKRVHETLRGPVIDIFIKNLPAFDGLSRAAAFDMIIGHHKLAEECFRLFRTRPDLFDDLLVGRNGERVTDASQPLYCGRSLDQVIALVVRAVAKRHFLKRFAPPRVVEPIPVPPTLWQQLKMLLEKPPPPARPRRKATRGDSLYRALSNHLLYEWQLPLIPHYTPLPVSMVRKLGARMLEFREANQLKTLLLEGPPPEPTPAPTPAPESNLSVESAAAAKAVPLSAKAEKMWKVAVALNLGKMFGIDEREMRRTVAHASAIGSPVVSAIGNSGLKMKEAVVLLCTMVRSLGFAKMGEFFGNNADPRLIAAFSEQLREEGIAAMNDTLNVREHAERIVNALKRAGHLGL
jgi:hypothetical protein